MKRKNPDNLLENPQSVGNSKSALLENQEGSAIVIAVMILMLLTIMGLMATNLNVTENLIVRNDVIYKRNFYRAEAAATEAALRIENSVLIDHNQMITTLTWLAGFNAIDFTNIANWNWDTVDPNQNAAVPDIINTGTSNLGGALTSDDTYMAMAFGGVSTGSSLKVTAGTKLYSFTAYGYCIDQGETLISLGYRKRF